MRLEWMTADQWAEISDAMLWLWVATGLIVMAAGLFLLRFAVLASVRQQGGLPRRARGIDALLVLSIVLAGMGGIGAAALMADLADVAYDILPRVWV